MKPITITLFIILLSFITTESEAQFGGKPSISGLKGKGLGNPFKNLNVEDSKKAFQKHVESDKLEVKHINKETGAQSYLNLKSGYSYNIDPEKKGKGKIPEKAHIDVNYVKKNTKLDPKKRLPLEGEN